LRTLTDAAALRIKYNSISNHVSKTILDFVKRCDKKREAPQSSVFVDHLKTQRVGLTRIDNSPISLGFRDNSDESTKSWRSPKIDDLDAEGNDGYFSSHNRPHHHQHYHQVKAKRKRASSAQLSALREVYEQTSFPSSETRKILARRLGMTPRSVQIWFQNQRQIARHGQGKPSL
jgi:hypothetical protein